MKKDLKINLTTKAFKAFVVFGLLILGNKIIAQPLTANAGPDQNICDGAGGVTIGGAPTATFGTPPYTYSWAPAFGLSSTTDPNPVATPNSSVTYTLTVTDATLATSMDGIYVGVTYPASAFAGGNMTICAGTPTVTLSASMGGSASTLTWTTSGTGTFSSPTSMVTTYTPSPADELAGNVILTMTTNDPPGPCPAAISSLTLTINPIPVATINGGTSFCDGGPISYIADPVAGATYSWSGPNGFSSTDQNPIINPAATINSGLYTLIVAVGACADTADITAVVNPTPSSSITGLADVICNGQSNGTATVTATGGTPPYLYFWDDGMSQTTATAVNLPAGNFNAYVSDANGCNAAGAMATINQPSGMFTNVFSPTICLGDSVTINPIVTGGVPPYSYVWDQGGTYYYTPTLPLAPTSSVTFTLNVTDANGCYSTTNPGITVNPLTEMYGTIDYSGGPLVNGGTAVLLNWYPTFTTFDTVQTYAINAAGTYFFSAVPAGNYLIKVFPDTLLYPLTVPTYFGDQYLWTLAQVKNHGCVDVDTANIFMVEGVVGVGPGMLQGVVLEGPGFGRLEGDPIPGIDIKLGRNPGGALVAQTTTNATGQFTFDNIDINTPGDYYTIYVDLPGRERDSTYNVIVTATNSTFNQLDFAVDSNSVYPINPVVTSTNNSNLTNENKFSVYPNPFNENTTIAYTLSVDAEVRLEIYNVLGVKIQNILSTKQQAGEFKYVLDNKVNAGVYFINLTINGKTTTQRVLKMK
jgi:hypothetical protein